MLRLSIEVAEASYSLASGVVLGFVAATLSQPANGLFSERNYTGSGVDLPWWCTCVGSQAKLEG